MTKDELKDCLGTIAQSGTSKFLKALKVHLFLRFSYINFLFHDKLIVSFVDNNLLSLFCPGEQRPWCR
jgi:hypothetical protein